MIKLKLVLYLIVYYWSLDVSRCVEFFSKSLLISSKKQIKKF